MSGVYEVAGTLPLGGNVHQEKDLTIERVVRSRLDLNRQGVCEGSPAMALSSSKAKKGCMPKALGR